MTLPREGWGVQPPIPAPPAEPAPRIDHPPGRTINILRVPVSIRVTLLLLSTRHADSESKSQVVTLPTKGWGGGWGGPPPPSDTHTYVHGARVGARGGLSANSRLPLSRPAPATNPAPARRARAENRASTRPYNQHFAGEHLYVRVIPTPSPSCDTPERGLGPTWGVLPPT